MAGHVQQGLQAGGGIHRAAHRTGRRLTNRHLVKKTHSSLSAWCRYVFISTWNNARTNNLILKSNWIFLHSCYISTCRNLLEVMDPLTIEHIPESNCSRQIFHTRRCAGILSVLHVNSRLYRPEQPEANRWSLCPACTGLRNKTVLL